MKAQKARTRRRRSSVLLTLAVLAAAAPAEAAGAPVPERAVPDGNDHPRPVREYVDVQGRACRVYARQIIIDGTPQTAVATVCREADGRWVLSH